MPGARRCVTCQERHDLLPQEALDPELLSGAMAVMGELDTSEVYG